MDGDIINGEGCRKIGEEKTARECRSEVSGKKWWQVLGNAGTIMIAALLIGAVAGPLCAQTYPNKPVRLILPNPPGGAMDTLGRVITQRFSEHLGQPVVAENRSGAAGRIGIEVVAKARPDGYTLLLSGQTLAVSPALYKKLNFDAINDFAPISLIAQVPNVLIVRPGMTVNSLNELVAYAKANPGKLKFGSGGIGHSTHLAGELLNYTAKIDILSVPYKGANQAMIAMLAGEVDMVIIGVSSAQAQIQSGKVRALCVLGEHRLPSLPGVPTSGEAGFDNFKATSWYGLFVPSGTPGEIVKRFNAEWVRSAAMPETKAQMLKHGLEPLSSTPEQLTAYLKEEILRWTAVAKAANIRLD
jgi:tripartite-type tricarboxylate transporter receptor subunit TctC